MKLDRASTASVLLAFLLLLHIPSVTCFVWRLTDEIPGNEKIVKCIVTKEAILGNERPKLIEGVREKKAVISLRFLLLLFLFVVMILIRYEFYNKSCALSSFIHFVLKLYKRLFDHKT